MSDLISTPLMAKMLSGIGGLIGGVSFMAFYKPCNVWDASVRSGLSTIATIVFAPVLIEYYNISMSSDNLLAVSVALGFAAWSVLSFAAKYLMRVQDEKTGLKLPKISIK